MDQGAADKPNTDLRCPECRQPLKRRRTSNPDECEMLCGGCGASFDICDLETVEALQKGQPEKAPKPLPPHRSKRQ